MKKRGRPKKDPENNKSSWKVTNLPKYIQNDMREKFFKEINLLKGNNLEKRAQLSDYLVKKYEDKYAITSENAKKAIDKYIPGLNLDVNLG